MNKLYAFLADGMEEVECLAVVDIARRGGIQAEMVSIMGRREVTGSHNITVLADRLFEETDFQAGDTLFLPGGGKGVENLTAHPGLAALLKEAAGRGDRIAAICAAPSVLGGLGLLEGRTATSYPTWREKVPCAHWTTQGVVTDGPFTTARGLGFAIDLGIELVRLLIGETEAQTVKERIQHPDC